MLTAERLRELLIYNAETGIFTWLSTGKGRRQDLTAGRLNKGRLDICVDYHRYFAHRLAWLYMTGAWPKDQIDHINTDRGDNRWCNLREATNFQNSGNRMANSNNTSGFKGVVWHEQCRKWVAAIRINRKLIYLGLFETTEDASAAYSAAAAKHFGKFARSS